MSECRVCEAETDGCAVAGCEYEIGDWELPLCNQHMAYAHALYDEYVWRCETKDRKRRREEALRDRWGWIYFILVGDKVKIGYAFDPHRRLKQYPPGSKVLATQPKVKKTDEAELHQRFAQYRVAGREWYRDCPEIRKAAAEIVRVHGKPIQPRWGDGQRRHRASIGRRPRGAVVVDGFTV